MATSSVEEKWEHPEHSTPEEEDQVREDEEEEEALSLCDLPVNMKKEENNHSSRDQEAHQETETNQEDFDFGPFMGGDGSLSNKSDMCAADDIFFQGQILPLRLSVSSESGVNKFKNDSSLNPCQCLSRSESMDQNSLGGFASFSSRSSSSRSHYSSGSSSTSSAIASTRMIKPIIQNHFLTYPSPKPQIRHSRTSLGNAASNRPRNSSVWDFFRLGLVRTPEIELQDLKVRNSVSRNSSSSSSNSNSSIKCSNINVGGGNIKSGREIKNFSRHNSNDSGKKMGKQSFLEKRGGLLSGCNCSVNAVKPVPLNNNIVVMKRSNSRSRSAGKCNNDKSERGSIELEEKLQELKMKKRMVQKQRPQQQGKQAMSRHRTFEWIKELSHATYLDHEEESV